MLLNDEVKVKFDWYGGLFIFPSEALLDEVLFEEYFDTNFLSYDAYKVCMQEGIDFLKKNDLTDIDFEKLSSMQETNKVEYEKLMFNLKKHLVSCELLNNTYKSKIYNYETTNYIDRMTSFPMPKYIRWIKVTCEGEKVDWNKIPSDIKKQIVHDTLIGDVSDMHGEIEFISTLRMAKRYNAFFEFEPVGKPVETVIPKKAEEKPAVPEKTTESAKPTTSTEPVETKQAPSNPKH